MRSGAVQGAYAGTSDVKTRCALLGRTWLPNADAGHIASAPTASSRAARFTRQIYSGLTPQINHPR
jgi:hypothetical protein